MSLKIAVQMDPLEKLNINSDTTIALIEEAQKRGHTVFIYTPDQLELNNNIVCATGYYIYLHNDPNISNTDKKHNISYTLSHLEQYSLQDFDVVLVRHEPPYDMAYLTSTYLLEKLLPSTLCINNPIGIRNAPEKVLITQFPQFTPPTLISRNIKTINAFIQQYKDVVLKPLYGYAGKEVFRLKQEDENTSTLLDMFCSKYSEHFIIQKFLPEVYEGDKRIFILDGEYIGGFNRIPSDGQFRSNLAVGGNSHKLKEADIHFAKNIASHMQKTLHANGLYFVGLDVIGQYVTEINVTCPTGLRMYQQLHNIDLAAHYWHGIEKQFVTS